MKKILIINKGLYHPSLADRKLLIRQVRQSGYDVTGKSSIDSSILNYPCIVLFFHEKEISADQVNLLEMYLQSGGMILAIHGALASYKSNNEYLNLLGGHFIGHDKVSMISISEAASDNSLKLSTRFFTIKDELYQFELKKSCEVILTGTSHEMTSPVLWKNMIDSGTVVCFSLGHKLCTLNSKEFVNILKSTLESLYEKN
ncbi:MAG: ThuA domain-containing protein [Clostridia bacterium]|nr:ThuA domain-containing protein [Clostridia bacterium]